ncbi:MAG: hypothetical protein LZF60_280070 [Nitrospira sp.]|nr:MAG: hypothetical protein LZF60_280070 [Nitrospira sp.]
MPMIGPQARGRSGQETAAAVCCRQGQTRPLYVETVHSLARAYVSFPTAMVLTEGVMLAREALSYCPARFRLSVVEAMRNIGPLSSTAE